MELRHQQIIKKNSDEIVKLIAYETFREKWLNHEIGTECMIKNVEKNKFLFETNTAALIRKTILRGPLAYRKFLNILLEMTEDIINIISDLTDHL